MSDNVIFKDGMNYPPAVVAWPAFSDKDHEDSDRPEFRAEVPADTAGILIVWKIPRCEAYPDGYFISLNESERNISVPGCAAWDQTELVRISFSDIVNAGSNNDTRDRVLTRASVVRKHDLIKLDETLLNPAPATAVLIKPHAKDEIPHKKV